MADNILFKKINPKGIEAWADELELAGAYGHLTSEELYSNLCNDYEDMLKHLYKSF